MITGDDDGWWEQLLEMNEKNGKKLKLSLNDNIMYASDMKMIMIIVEKIGRYGCKGVNNFESWHLGSSIN